MLNILLGFGERAVPTPEAVGTAFSFTGYILSREGQQPILYWAYFPLTAEEAREERAKLE